MDEEKSELRLEEVGTLEKRTENVLRDIQFTDAKGPSISSKEEFEEHCSVSDNGQVTPESVLLNQKEEKDDDTLCKISINSTCKLKTSTLTMDVTSIGQIPSAEPVLPCEMSSEALKNAVLSTSSPMLVPSDSSISNICAQNENIISEGDKLLQSDNKMLSNDSNVPCSVIKSDLNKDVVKESSESIHAKEILNELHLNGVKNNVDVTNIINKNFQSIKVENSNEHGSPSCSVQFRESSKETSTEHITKVEPLTDVIKRTENEYLDSYNLGTTTIPTREVKAPIIRPTLVDDSRLVKISLPTNPMNMMPSNTQFLNKSRHFLNFITEKSTNIMEKALLPQHLAVKYNPNLRITDTATAKKSTVISQPAEIVDNGKSHVPLNYVEKDSASTIKQNEKHAAFNNCEVTVCNTRRNDTSEETCLSNINREVTEDHMINVIKNFDVHSGCTTFNSEVNECQHSTEESSQSSKEDPNSLAHMNLHNAYFRIKDPEYLTLCKEYSQLETRNHELSIRVQNLEKEKEQLVENDGVRTGMILVMQIDSLEHTVDRLKNELRSALATQDVLKREHATANKERESMVMKYAVGEKQLIDTQRAKDNAERKLKETMKDNELLQTKLRQLQGERTRICNILDSKCRDVTDLQREVERLKEEVNRREVKLKWSQTKLKTEMELQKETQQKLDKALTRINDMKEECDQIRRETQESIRQFQMSEENKAVTLDQQLKEQQAQLILERHVTEDKEMIRLQLQKEVEVLQNRQQALIEENNTLSLKIQDTEKNRLNYESSLSNLKILADQRQKDVVDLLGKVSQLETVKLQLQHTEQCLASIETEIDHLRDQNAELQQDMSACRQREADMLDFTQKLTEKNVRIQSEFTAIEARAKQLNEEQGPLRERVNELMMKMKMLEKSLVEEKKKRLEECEILAKHVAEQTQLAQNLAQKLEESQGENAVLKRKQQISMKEMTREIQQCRRKLEAYEGASPSNSLGINSRTASNTSLNTGDTINGALSDNSANVDQAMQSLEPSTQTLMERIIQLQNMNCKREEKIDFFEEHTRTLVEELQKKEKIIQNYILHSHSGAMGSNEMDMNKAELAKHGGIMASVYSQRKSDNKMTLELSLQINQKQQAVLEDALLKNITLKNNIDTLSQEIARLTMQIQQRKVAS